LQAHGHTSDRDAPESFEQDADDVTALLHYLIIDKADFMGFSNGGNTIMKIAMRHPQLVNKLIIASSFYKREGMVKGFFEGMGKATIENMPLLLKEAFLKINNDSSKLQAMFEKDKQRMVTFKDWKEEDLASIKAPSLIIAGDRDVMTTEHAVEMSHKIPNARLLILPGTHGSYMGEESTEIKGNKMHEYTVALIETFLSGN